MRELRAYLDGVSVGTFEMTDSGRVSFRYENDYAQRPDATPMSLSMRASRPAWGSRQATPFLAGLLPDSPDRLRDLAARFRTGEHPFRLLEHVGRDAAGAVQLLSPDEGASDAALRTGDVDRLGEEDFSDLLRSLVRSPGTWGHDEFGGRWSLAGAQSKVALFRFDDGGWGVPNDSTPTTHILKPALDALPDHDVNEYVTMEAARLLGLDVADHELVALPDGSRVFVSRRYDRAVGDGRYHRLHQEDLCQAMSVDPARKYQEQGGPSVRQIAALLRESTQPGRERTTLQRAFFDGLVFNAAAFGTDAHAKNFSLLLDGRSVRLAPLYDLASHAAYPNRSGAPLLSAMSIGDEFALDRIGEPQFVDVARALAIPADEAVERYGSITGGIAEAFDRAAATVEAPFASRLATAVAANASRRGW